MSAHCLADLSSPDRLSGGPRVASAKGWSTGLLPAVPLPLLQGGSLMPPEAIFRIECELSGDFGGEGSNFEVKAALVTSGIIIVGVAALLVIIDGSSGSGPTIGKCFLLRS